MSFMKNRNVVLTFLSYQSFIKDLSESNYNYANSKDYRGVYSNDAPVKCLIDIAKNEGNPISDIIYIETPEVRDNILESAGLSMTTRERFINLFTEYCEEEVLFKSIEYNPSGKGQAKILNIYDGIVRFFDEVRNSGAESINVYIDYTGGMRDIAFFMTMIVRYLDFNGIECKKIVYSEYNAKEIHDISFIYDMMQMINGVSEFLSSGNTNILRKIDARFTKEEHRNILKTIQDFSEGVQLCSVKDLGVSIGSLNNIITKYNTSNYYSEVEVEKLSEDSLFNHMFSTLIPKIKEKMHLNNYNGFQLEYPNVIQWCMDNGMIQQAITLYIEKMPQYYIEKKMIPNVLDYFNIEKSMTEKDLKKHSNLYADVFYEKFYDAFFVDKDRVAFERYIKYLLKVNNKKSIEETKGKSLETLKKKYLSGNEMISPAVEKAVCSLTTEISDIYFHNRGYAEQTTWTGYCRSAEKKVNDYLCREKLKTLSKKVKAITELETIIEQPIEEKLSMVMTYYLVMKVIRNRVLHASEEDLSDEYNKVMWLANRKGVTKDKEIIIDIETIKSIIEGGLESSKELQDYIISNNIDTIKPIIKKKITKEDSKSDRKMTKRKKERRSGPWNNIMEEAFLKALKKEKQDDK